MKTLVVVLIFLASQHHECRAQLDDLAESAWAVPQLDAIDFYRNAPLCLRCVTASELTVLPGIGRRTASTIVRSIDQGAASLDYLCDAACLSSDQRVVLATCTTFECDCGPSLAFARSLVRFVSTNDVSDVTSRVDVASSLGRVGGIFRDGPTVDALAGWIETSSGPFTAVLGNHAFSVGTGLVHGTSGGFGRSVLNRAQSVDASIRLRPWTSSWTELALQGIAISYHPSMEPVQAIVSVSTPSFQFDQSMSIAAATLVHTGEVLWGLTALHYDRNLMGSVVAETSLRGVEALAEFAMDPSGNIATVAVFKRRLSNKELPLNFTAALRYASIHFSSPLSSPLSSRTREGNETGLLLGVNVRRPRSWAIEASLDLHSTLSRSYGSPLPSRGVDLLVDGSIRATKMSTVNIRLRHEVEGDGWTPPNKSVRQMQERTRSTIRAELSHFPTKQLRIRLRADSRFVSYSSSGKEEIGTLLFGELQWTPSRMFRLTFRTTVYSAPSIDAAAYTLEVPMTGFMQTVAGTGQGDRLLLSARASVTHWLSVQAMVLRWSRRSSSTTHRAAAQVNVSI